MSCKANECEVNYTEMIETEIEKALSVTHGTWVSYTHETGCRQRFKAKSDGTMFRLPLDTLDWPNTHFRYTLKQLIKVRCQERYTRVHDGISCT